MDNDLVSGLARQVASGDSHGIRDLFRDLTLDPPLIVLDPDLDDLPTPAHRILLEYWRQHSTANAPMRRADLDPTELRGALGILLLLEADESGLDFIYRVYGTRIAEHARADWTGWSIGAVSKKLSSGLGPFYRSVYMACAQTKRPIYTVHTSPHWLSASSWQRLIVPMVDDLGRPTFFLVANLPAVFRDLDDESKIEQRRRLGPA